jgi:hypothetical protein
MGHASQYHRTTQGQETLHLYSQGCHYSLIPFGTTPPKVPQLKKSAMAMEVIEGGLHQWPYIASEPMKAFRVIIIGHRIITKQAAMVGYNIAYSRGNIASSPSVALSRLNQEAHNTAPYSG